MVSVYVGCRCLDRRPHKMKAKEMTEEQFDWDEYLATASYSEVAANSPDLSSRRRPSLYSPDKKHLNLPSIDCDVSTADEDELKQSLKFVLEAHQRHRKSGSLLGQLEARIDCIELVGLLSRLVEDPDQYMDPDALLDAGNESE